MKVRIQNYQSLEDVTLEVQGLTVLTGPNNSGKALKNGTLVATPNGWVSVESLSVGDLVVAGDGSPTSVVGVFPQGVRPTYIIEFDDGRRVTVDEDHLWCVSIGSHRFPKDSQTWEVLTTKSILQKVGPNPSGVNRPSIPSAGAVRYTPSPTPVDPYLLGVLLGDGSLSKYNVGFTTMDEEILRGVEDVLPSGLRLIRNGYAGYRIAQPKDIAKRLGNPILTGCRDLGVLVGSDDKFIPNVYKYNTIEVRLAVLQGLMDTDGSAEHNGGVNFYTTSDLLADDVTEIVRSLGGKVRRTLKPNPVYTHKGEKRIGKPCHVLGIRLLGRDNFRLSRKLSRVRTPVRRNDPLIVSIVPAGDHQCTCIAVDHPSHLFQVEGHIVTHNSAVIRALSGVFQNTAGSHFVRFGQPHTSVHVSFGESDNILWEKGAKVNKYDVNGKVLDKVGLRVVPEEVTNYGIFPLEVAGKDIWPQFAPQFDPLFLLNNTGTFFAEAISDASTVGVLNESLRECQSDRKRTQSELDVRLKDLVKLEKNLREFDGIEETCKSLDVIVSKGKQLEDHRRSNIVPLEGYKAERSRRISDILSFDGIEDLSVPKAPRDNTGEIEVLGGLHERLLRATGALSMFPTTSWEMPQEGRIPKLFEALRILIELRSSRQELMGQLQRVFPDAPKGLTFDWGDDARDLASRRKEQETLLKRIGDALLSLEQELLVVCQEVNDLKGTGPCPFCGSEHENN